MTTKRVGRGSGSLECEYEQKAYFALYAQNPLPMIDQITSSCCMRADMDGSRGQSQSNILKSASGLFVSKLRLIIIKRLH